MYQISNPIQFYPYRPLALCDFSVYHRQQRICSRISPLILHPLRGRDFLSSDPSDWSDPLSGCDIKKSLTSEKPVSDWLLIVGVTRLELATSRPPDAYSNQLSYTPRFLSQKRCKGMHFFYSGQIFLNFFWQKFLRLMPERDSWLS